MKTSVYVPDNLWLKFRILHPETNPSTLLQASIVSLLAEDGPPTKEQIETFWNQS